MLVITVGFLFTLGQGIEKLNERKFKLRGKGGFVFSCIAKF